jgi:4'-phosphopantetheinyl transferase
MMTNPIIWHIPAENMNLAENDIHIWLVSEDNPPLPLKELGEILSNDEQERANRFHFERDKNRYIVGRGILRTLIGKYYLDIEPKRLEFCTASKGKPALKDTFGRRRLKFNQADSNGMALYAISQTHEIGIDIECIRDISSVQEIVEGSFSKYEIAAFKALPADEKQRAFFNCWTRKEAFIKAIGQGLYFSLDQFDVAFTPGETPKILSIRGDRAEAAKWSLFDLKPLHGYSAALAYKGLISETSYWRFE